MGKKKGQYKGQEKKQIIYTVGVVKTPKVNARMTDPCRFSVYRDAYIHAVALAKGMENATDWDIQKRGACVQLTQETNGKTIGVWAYGHNGKERLVYLDATMLQ